MTTTTTADADADADACSRDDAAAIVVAAIAGPLLPGNIAKAGTVEVLGC